MPSIRQGLPKGGWVGGADLIGSFFSVIVGIGGKHAFLPERTDRRLPSFLSFLIHTRKLRNEFIWISLFFYYFFLYFSCGFSLDLGTSNSLGILNGLFVQILRFFSILPLSGCPFFFWARRPPMNAGEYPLGRESTPPLHLPFSGAFIWGRWLSLHACRANQGDLVCQGVRG